MTHSTPTPALVWSKEPPSVAGWFWKCNGAVREDIRVRAAQIVCVAFDSGVLRYFSIDREGTQRVSSCGRRVLWSGPIPTPTEPGRAEVGK